MYFHFILPLILLLHDGLNCLTILSSHHQGGLLIDSVSWIPLDNCIGSPVISEPCNIFVPVKLLLSVLHNHILHSTPLMNYLTLDIPIGLVGRVFANGPGDRGSIPGRAIQRLKKWYLMPPCLTLSIIRSGSRVKWSNPGKGVAPSPTPW